MSEPCLTMAVHCNKCTECYQFVVSHEKQAEAYRLALEKLDLHFNSVMGLCHALKVHQDYWDKLIKEPKEMIQAALTSRASDHVADVSKKVGASSDASSLGIEIKVDPTMKEGEWRLEQKRKS